MQSRRLLLNGLLVGYKIPGCNCAIAAWKILSLSISSLRLYFTNKNVNAQHSLCCLSLLSLAWISSQFTTVCWSFETSGLISALRLQMGIEASKVGLMINNFLGLTASQRQWRLLTFPTTSPNPNACQSRHRWLGTWSAVNSECYNVIFS